MPQLDEIQDFYDLTPLALTSGQPTAEQFPLIKEAGCELVINLAQIKEGSGLEGEDELVKSLGMDYIHIPVIWTQPLPSDLEAFFEAMRPNHGRKIYVHCIRNFRVSAFMFLYRVLRLGVDEKDARLDLKIIWKPNEIWAAFITERLSALRASDQP
jgi:protein tyrosine phosphatase (PTP) superfamily phosphohydrolase (DUF442 family)